MTLQERIAKKQAEDKLKYGGCPLLEESEKLETDDILNTPLTLVDVGQIVSKAKNETVFVAKFAEYPNHFYFCPSILAEIVESILDNSHEIEELRKDGLKMELTKVKGKKNSYIDVII